MACRRPWATLHSFPCPSCFFRYPLSRIPTDLQITSYLIAQAVGGVLVSPLSETFGRRTLYIAASAIFCVFNILIAAVHSDVTVYIGRFVTGFVASIPATVAFGNFDDLYDSKSRIWVVYLYTTFGNFGLVLGPIYGVYITEKLGW